MKLPEDCRWSFPPVSDWGAREDVVAVGADLEPDTLVFAYSRGIFPMYLDEENEALGWCHRRVEESCRSMVCESQSQCVNLRANTNAPSTTLSIKSSLHVLLLTKLETGSTNPLSTGTRNCTSKESLTVLKCGTAQTNLWAVCTACASMASLLVNQCSTGSGTHPKWHSCTSSTS